LGHSKQDHHEIHVYPDTRYSNGGCIRAYGGGECPTGWNESWVQNSCVLYSQGVP
jgi:hypothetical protein